MGKRQKDMRPFRYWRASEGNSECTDVVNVIKVQRQKDICIGKSRKDMCPFGYWSVVNVIKVRSQKEICMGKRTCVLLAIGEQEREIQNAQVNFIKVQRQKKKKIDL